MRTNTEGTCTKSKGRAHSIKLAMDAPCLMIQHHKRNKRQNSWSSASVQTSYLQNKRLPEEEPGKASAPKKISTGSSAGAETAHSVFCTCQNSASLNFITSSALCPATMWAKILSRRYPKQYAYLLYMVRSSSHFALDKSNKAFMTAMPPADNPAH